MTLSIPHLVTVRGVYIRNNNHKKKQNRTYCLSGHGELDLPSGNVKSIKIPSSSNTSSFTKKRSFTKTIPPIPPLDLGGTFRSVYQISRVNQNRTSESAEQSASNAALQPEDRSVLIFSQTPNENPNADPKELAKRIVSMDLESRNKKIAADHKAQESAQRCLTPESKVSSKRKHHQITRSAVSILSKRQNH